MANFLSPKWINQAGKDIDKFFAGDKAVESDEVVEVNKKINGGSGMDTLSGGDGDDTINGG